MKKKQEKTVQKQLKAKCFSVECPDMNMGDNSNGNINIDTQTQKRTNERESELRMMDLVQFACY